MSDFDDLALPPAPLDLAALEHLFQMGGGTTHYAGCEVVHSMCAARALLAHCRALQAALESTRQGRCWCILQGGPGAHSDHCQTITAVLAAARDGPA